MGPKLFQRREPVLRANKALSPPLTLGAVCVLGSVILPIPLLQLAGQVPMFSDLPLPILSLHIIRLLHMCALGLCLEDLLLPDKNALPFPVPNLLPPWFQPRVIPLLNRFARFVDYHQRLLPTADGVSMSIFPGLPSTPPAVSRFAPRPRCVPFAPFPARPDTSTPAGGFGLSARCEVPPAEHIRPPTLRVCVHCIARCRQCRAQPRL